MKKQFFGFKCAFRGVLEALDTEGHLRFHFVAGFYALIFSLFYDFTKAQTAVLVLLIAAVAASEIFNTCIERICDLISKEYDRTVRFIKDAAAGAVLILSAAAVVTAVVFYFDFEVIKRIFEFFISNPVYALLLLLSAVLSVIFVMLGPSKTAAAIRKIKKK